MAIGALIGSFFINTAASIGLNLLGSWISPKKSNSIPENIPSAGTGQPLYLCWGSTFVPCFLFYAVPSNKAGHGDDKSSYGLLGFSNPDSTSQLEAIRSNGIIVSSKTSLFNLNAPENVIPGANKFVNSYGLTTYNNFNYKVQLGSNVANSHFGLLNQAGLQYQGLSWLKIEAAERKLFGGFNNRTVMYVLNRISAFVSASFTVTGNAPVTVQTNVGRQGWFTIQWDDILYNYPTGFFGVRIHLYFEGKGNRGFSLLGYGGNVEYVIRQDVFDCNYTLFTISGAITPGATPTTKGKYTIGTVNANQRNNQYTVTTALIGTDQGAITQVNLITPGQAPLYSVNGIIKDRNDLVVYTGNASSKLYGWDGKMFSENPFRDVLVEPLTPRSAPRSGTVTTGTTKLSTIFKDLLVTKGVALSEITFTNFTDVDVRGFTCTDDNVKQQIINLCTAYGKIVDDGFGKEYTFKDYPTDLTAISIGLSRHLAEPIIEYADEINQPKQVELTFRDWQNEYSEKSVTVGYGSDFPNTSSQKLDLILTQQEAKKLAWNMYFLLGHTNMAVRLNLDDASGIENGTVLTVDNPGTEPLKLLVGNIEIGADCTFLVNCVNWVPLNQYNSSNPYLPYMISESAPAVFTTPPVQADRQIYLAEPTSLDVSDSLSGALFYTTDTNNYSSLNSSSGFVSLNNVIPNTFGFKGFLTSISSDYLDFDDDYLEYGIRNLAVSRNADNSSSLPASGLIRIGQSWVSYSSIITNGGTNILQGVKIGLYGSTRYVRVGEAVVNLTTSNKVKGYTATATALSLSKVVQSTTSETFTYFDPPNPADPDGVPIAEVSSFAPYGAPACGIVVSDLLTCADSGKVRIWFTAPGNVEDVGFFLNSPVTTNEIPFTQFWLKPDVGAAVYLGDFDPVSQGYVELEEVVGAGGYTIYQGLAGGGVSPAGSFIHRGVARG
jgi:hypothetical protein